MRWRLQTLFWSTQALSWNLQALLWTPQALLWSIPVESISFLNPAQPFIFKEINEKTMNIYEANEDMKEFEELQFRRITHGSPCLEAGWKLTWVLGGLLRIYKWVRGESYPEVELW